MAFWRMRSSYGGMRGSCCTPSAEVVAVVVAGAVVAAAAMDGDVVANAGVDAEVAGVEVDGSGSGTPFSSSPPAAGTVSQRLLQTRSSCRIHCVGPTRHDRGFFHSDEWQGCRHAEVGHLLFRPTRNRARLNRERVAQNRYGNRRLMSHGCDPGICSGVVVRRTTPIVKRRTITKGDHTCAEPTRGMPCRPERREEKRAETDRARRRM